MDVFCFNLIKNISEFRVPNIISASDDMIKDTDYSAFNISWIATDANPNTYTIELLGVGI